MRKYKIYVCYEGAYVFDRVEEMSEEDANFYAMHNEDNILQLIEE